jgi:integrase
MYRDVAIDEKYITMGEFPIFRYLKVQKDSKPKRDILEQQEFQDLRKWMTNVWCREKDIDELERVKRYCFGLYLTIQYYGGFRNKEVLGIRWGDVKQIKKSSKLEQRINRSIYIPEWNAKTGVSREVVAPVGMQFERLKEHYKKLGITEFGREDYVFINLAKTKRGQNIPYQQPAMEKRLHAVVEGSGLKKILLETGRHITQYSARHYAVVDALMRNVSVYDCAMNYGTSVHYIEKTYAKQLTAMMKQKELTKGQGYWKEIERREKEMDDGVTE